MADSLTEALQDPEYRKWWEAKERYIESHNTDEHPGQEHHIDKYRVTIEYEVEFSRENDGVLSEHDVEMWLRAGEIDWGMCESKILKAQKGG